MLKASTKRIIDTMLTNDLFASVGDEELKLLATEYTTEKTFQKGKVIFSKDSKEKCIGIIIKGSAQVRKEHIVISHLKQGDLFGAVTLYGNSTSFVNDIIADNDCKIAFISRAGIDYLISKSPKFAKKFIEYLSKRIYFLNSRIESYTMPTADEKLYNYLVSVARNSEVQLNGKMTDLAKSLNLSRASLYRAFDELCEKNKISKDGKNIKLL